MRISISTPSQPLVGDKSYKVLRHCSGRLNKKNFTVIIGKDMKEQTVIKSSTPGFLIECENPNCPGGRIETTMEDDSGYSNWTVMDSGKIAFKCHGCGKYGSTDKYDNPNELSNFKVICLNCSEYNQKDENWDYNIGDVDGESERTYIQCKSCGQRVLGRD